MYFSDFFILGCQQIKHINCGSPTYKNKAFLEMQTIIAI